MADLLTGKQGRVKVGSVVANVGEWGITPADEIIVKRTSATREGPVRVKTIEKWSGSYTASGGLPASLPGDAMAFEGVVSGAAGVADRVWEGAARCNEAVITINYESGEPVFHVVSFESNGALTVDDGSTVALDAVQDADDFVIPVGPTMGVHYGEVGAWATELADVKLVVITLTSANPPRTTSSTAGVEMHDAGNIDAKMSISVIEADPTVFGTLTDTPFTPGALSIGTIAAWKVLTNATEFWALEYMTVESVGDITVNTENEDLIDATIELGYSAIKGTDPGQIIKPGGGSWFEAVT